MKLGDTCTPKQADEYLAVLAEREKQANKKLALYTAVVAGCAILAIPAWDILKHSMGWLK